MDSDLATSQNPPASQNLAANQNYYPQEQPQVVYSQDQIVYQLAPSQSPQHRYTDLPANTTIPIQPVAYEPGKLEPQNMPATTGTTSLANFQPTRTMFFALVALCFCLFVIMIGLSAGLASEKSRADRCNGVFYY